jgi:hypothetical protein
MVGPGAKMLKAPEEKNSFLFQLGGISDFCSLYFPEFKNVQNPKVRSCVWNSMDVYGISMVYPPLSGAIFGTSTPTTSSTSSASSQKGGWPQIIS